MDAETMIKAGRRNIDVAQECGLSVDQVKRLRKKLGLSRYRSNPTVGVKPDLFTLVNTLMRPCATIPTPRSHAYADAVDG